MALPPSSSWVCPALLWRALRRLLKRPAGEILAQALPQLERNIHPVVIIQAFKRALADALAIISQVATPVEISDDKAMRTIIHSSIGTKFASRWSELMCDLALTAVRTVSIDVGGKQEVDIKRYARVEKIPGGEIEDSQVLDGIMLNKDITHPKMRRRIENARVMLLDCPLEYKKGESQTNIEISKEDDWNRILQIEEEQVRAMCDAIVTLQPDLVITEKGISGRLLCFPYSPIPSRLSTDTSRSRAAFPRQGQHHRPAARAQNGQQPHCPRHGCHHRQLGPERDGIRRWNVRSVRD